LENLKDTGRQTVLASFSFCLLGRKEIALLPSTTNKREMRRIHPLFVTAMSAVTIDSRMTVIYFLSVGISST
jgi:hypothetical protein